MNSKYTQTPWVVGATSPDGTDVQSQSLNGEGDYVALVYSEDDAPLIAAAPELYVALRTIAEAAEGHVPVLNDWVLRVARAALAKVEG